MKSTMLNRMVSPVSISLFIIIVAAMGIASTCGVDYRVETDNASGITTDAATLNGNLIIDTGTVNVSFEYGFDDSYGFSTAEVYKGVGGSYSTQITELSLDTLYHFRAKARGDQTTRFGVDKTFKTSGVTTEHNNTSSSTTTTSSTAASTHAITQASTTIMPAYPPTTQPVSTIVPTHVFIPDIAGEWQWNLTVTVANGACAGEEGPQAPYTVQITENGEDVTISGFLASNPSTSISGKIMLDNTIDKWVVTFSGSYAEDGGTTTTNYRLLLNNTYDTMTGDEAWSWALGTLTCKDCKSIVVANKLP